MHNLSALKYFSGTRPLLDSSALRHLHAFRDLKNIPTQSHVTFSKQNAFKVAVCALVVLPSPLHQRGASVLSACLRAHVSYHGSTPSEAGAGVFILADTPKIAKSKTGVENYGSVSMGRYQGSVSRGLPPMGHS